MNLHLPALGRALLLFASVSLPAYAQSTPATVTGKTVEYDVNGTHLKGYLALPKNVKGKLPGVVVVHEWWGHNEYARHRADMLAELGYAAFALDMYGKGKQAEEPKGAEHLMTEALSSGQIKARFDGAVKLLSADPQVDATNIAAIGYCFGGNVVLSMAVAGEPLKGVVSFHGSMPAAAPLAKGVVKAKVLILHGADDQFVKADALTAFKKELDGGGVDYQFVSYPGAKHGFTDKSNSMRGEMHHIPVGYNKDADEKSWAAMKTFFTKVFAQGSGTTGR